VLILLLDAALLGGITIEVLLGLVYENFLLLSVPFLWGDYNYKDHLCCGITTLDVF
jgi:hypothetical protein